METVERELPTPGELREQFPLTEEAILAVKTHRSEISDILAGRDDRLLVIDGMCSMDSSVQPDGTPSVLRFAHLLNDFARQPHISQNLKIVLRGPVSKPRTAGGWAGLSQTEPERAYALATDLANTTMPFAIELMSRDDADYYENHLSLGWVGARNVEDTNLRHVVSDLRLPVLFKNSTNGSMIPAENAIATAGMSNIVKRMRPNGRLVVKSSAGNSETGIIFRGGNVTTPEQFAQQFIRIRGSEHPIVVDCSHGNSEAFGEGKKTPEAQLACIKAVRTLMQSGHLHAKGVMIESYLLAGSDSSGKTPGKSLTDPCIDIDRTLGELDRLARLQASLKTRRLGSTGMRSMIELMGSPM